MSTLDLNKPPNPQGCLSKLGIFDRQPQRLGGSNPAFKGSWAGSVAGFNRSLKE
jgi:hypothetical protein